MDLIETVRSCWKEKFLTEIPDEFITRLECHIPRTTGVHFLDEVNILLSVFNETNAILNELNSKIVKEEFFLELLSILVCDGKEENVDRKRKNSKSKFDVQVLSLYAQVNKATKNKQSTTEQNDTTINNPVTVHSDISKCVSVDESPYEEIHFKNCPEMIKQTPHTSVVHGSIKNKIKLFENSDSSFIEASPGVEGDFAELKASKDSRKSVRCQMNNEYEELPITLSLQQKSLSPSNPDKLSLPSQSSDNSYMAKFAKSNLPTKHEEFSLSNQMLKSDSNANSKQKGPPVPARRSKWLDKESIGYDLKRTEELTLKHCDHEPQVASSKRPVMSNLGGQQVGTGQEKNNNTLYQKIDYNSLALSEGEYCSVKDVESEIKQRHPLFSQITSADKKENVDKRCSKDHEKAVSVKKGLAKKLFGSSENFLTEEFKILKESSSWGKSVDDLKDDNSLGEYCSLKDIGELSSGNKEIKKILGLKQISSISKEKAEQSQDVEVVNQDFLQHVDVKALNNKNVDTNSLEKALSLQESLKLGKSNRGKKKQVPDYEKWNFQTLITHTGISIADNDNLTDTGSDDDTIYDNVTVTDKLENNFGLSNDTEVCNTTSTPEEQPVQDEALCEILEDRVDGIRDATDLSSINFSRLFDVSCVTVDGDGISLQDGPGVLDDDKLSLSSMDDMAEKNDDFEDLSIGDTVLTKQLRMRQLVVKGILESEKAYLFMIEQLIKAKYYLQASSRRKENAPGIIALDDITTIFYKMEEFQKIHKEFVDELNKQVSNWNAATQIAPAVTKLVFCFKCYEDYVQNYPKALKTIQKYQKNEDTRKLLEELIQDAIKKEETLKLEDILLKPVQRIQTIHLVLHDLLNHTPTEHPDYESLQKALQMSEANLQTYKSLNYGKKEEIRHLVKNGFVVEVSRDKKHTRHLRYVLIFNDILICTKHKGSSKQKDAVIKHVWSLPLAPLSMHYKGDQQYEQKESLEELKTKIYQLKCELKDEMLKVDGVKGKPFSITQRRITKNMEKLKKKIQEQEATLVEGLPQLPLHLDVQAQKQQEGFKQRTFVFSTDYEREEWREVLEFQHVKCQGMPIVHLSAHDCEALINHNKVHIQINSIGSMLMMKEDEILNGSLNVTIHKMQGLEKPCDVYCCLEMDSYGHFYKKAQTKVSHFVTDASWNEDFELELDDSQTLRILCYKKQPSEEEDTVIGKCALEIYLTISVQHTPASKTLKRTESKIRTGMFGIRLSNITKQERKTVPSIVTVCVQQIEKRGLHEVGIYRVSGVTSDILHFKKLFDKNVIVATNQIEEADIHAITGLLKLYLRELPEPLFTNKQYQQFLQTMQLQNEDGKEKCMLTLLHSLPEPNYYTIVYIIEHLVRVSARSVENKMSIGSLSTVLGPTLMHPAMKYAGDDPLTQITLAAKNASLESEVIQFFIKLAASGKILRRPVKLES